MLGLFREHKININFDILGLQKFGFVTVHVINVWLQQTDLNVTEIHEL